MHWKTCTRLLRTTLFLTENNPNNRCLKQTMVYTYSGVHGNEMNYLLHATWMTITDVWKKPDTHTQNIYYVIQFLGSSKQAKLMYGDNSAGIVLTGREHKRAWWMLKLLLPLDQNTSYTRICICKSSSHCTLKTCVLCSLYASKTKKCFSENQHTSIKWLHYVNVCDHNKHITPFKKSFAYLYFACLWDLR